MGKQLAKVYVVYDQFHWLDADHLEYQFKGLNYALDNYRFLKASHPDKVLGLLEVDKYKKLKESYKQEACQVCGRNKN